MNRKDVGRRAAAVTASKEIVEAAKATLPVITR